MHPRRIFVVPELPLTSAKKIDRTALKKRAEEAAAKSSRTKAAS
jgi:acyl-coenzyme A synthetase/AMP-(fatty) acid ligase